MVQKPFCALCSLLGRSLLWRRHFADIWAARLFEAESAQKAAKTQLKDVDKQIEALLERIVNANSASVIAAYESRIYKLEREKLRLQDQTEKSAAPKGHLTDFIEPALKFRASPLNIYENGNFALRQTVLRLAFAEPLCYNRENGYRTAKITFPFRVLADFSTQKCEMVGDPGIEFSIKRDLQE